MRVQEIEPGTSGREANVLTAMPSRQPPAYICGLPVNTMIQTFLLVFSGSRCLMLCIASHCYVAVARVLSVDFAKSVVSPSHCLSDESTVIKIQIN